MGVFRSMSKTIIRVLISILATSLDQTARAMLNRAGVTRIKEATRGDTNQGYSRGKRDTARIKRVTATGKEEQVS